MPNNLPTRMCDGCGQVWSSGSFLDPTTEAECGFCGEPLAHRRPLPDGGVALLREQVVEQLPVPSQTAVA
jgi:ribosomal protein S27E